MKLIVSWHRTLQFCGEKERNIRVQGKLLLAARTIRCFRNNNAFCCPYQLEQLLISAPPHVRSLLTTHLSVPASLRRLFMSALNPQLPCFISLCFLYP